MPELGGVLPASVRERARHEVFFATADQELHGGRAPVLIWMHGRTANKELDPARFLRLVRAGIATVSLDLPGHGARHDDELQQPARTLEFVEQMAGEIDGVVEAMRATGWFDDTRMAIGGMSAGGMATLVRLCSAHRFRAACVECATGSFAWQRHRAMYDAQRAARLDPIAHLDGWRAIPLLVLHNELDAWVAVDGQREFVETLRVRTGRPELV